MRLPESLNLHVPGHLLPADARRQTRSAEELLARLAVQPGVILGDEVGMGKTFVALAVASACVVADPSRPVVVMVPGNVAQKWVRDASTFRERCLDGEDRARLRVACAETGVGLLKLLDDPPQRRASLIVLAHGALHRKVADKWVKLAMLQAAVKGRPGCDDLRRRLARFAPMILSNAREPDREFSLYLRLLETPPANWLPVLAEAGQGPRDGDNPVPAAFVEALGRVDLSPLYRTLAECLPGRRSEQLVERIRRARKALEVGDTTLPVGQRGSIADVWVAAVQHSRLSFPLLVLDEAHRARNDGTQLAALLRARDEELDAAGGQLANRFDRMLFLTATPFQLGHRELVNVLRRFEAICWDGAAAPTMVRTVFRERTAALQGALDTMQLATDGLERAWKRLRHADMAEAQEQLGEAWWEAHTDAAQGVDERVRGVVLAFDAARSAVRTAQACLQPWLLRNTRSPWLATLGGPVPRRVRITGEAVLQEAQAAGEAGSVAVGGLKVRDDSMLPFLLVARMATLPNVSKVFSEGLPSSYEAALDTRRDKADPSPDDTGAVSDAGLDQRRARWYDERLREAALSEEAKGLGTHPKLQATVELAMSLWSRGEKVLIFAHYQQTGAALLRHLSEAMLAATERQGALTFGCAPHEVAAQVESRQSQIDDRPADEAIAGVLDAMLEKLPALRGEGLPERLKSVVKRFMRTATFLVRFGGRRDEPSVAEWVRNMFDRPDASGLSLRMLVAQFLDFLARLESRSQQAYLDALDSIRTGIHAGGAAEASFDADEVADAELRKVRLVPNVGRVYGDTHDDTKERRLLAFNTPFYPEILVASNVAAEGVDLHLNCSHVIHHDLDWNPSSLEQRTGRVDRLGAKCERAGRSIRVYLPYVEGCQDEKLFRVVMDRELWFGAVMGADQSMTRLLSANPWELERLADAVPVPERLVADLAMRGLAVEPHVATATAGAIQHAAGVAA